MKATLMPSAAKSLGLSYSKSLHQPWSRLTVTELLQNCFCNCQWYLRFEECHLKSFRTIFAFCTSTKKYITLYKRNQKWQGKRWFYCWELLLEAKLSLIKSDQMFVSVGFQYSECKIEVDDLQNSWSPIKIKLPSLLW